jgi:hypothetical protein
MGRQESTSSSELPNAVFAHRLSSFEQRVIKFSSSSNLHLKNRPDEPYVSQWMSPLEGLCIVADGLVLHRLQQEAVEDPYKLEHTIPGLISLLLPSRSPVRNVRWLVVRINLLNASSKAEPASHFGNSALKRKAHTDHGKS